MDISPQVWTQLILAVATLLVAVAGWLKSQTNGKKLDDNTSMTKDIHIATNGKMTELVSAVQNAATAAATAAMLAQAHANKQDVQMSQQQAATPKEGI
jgi:hypothetical protein